VADPEADELDAYQSAYSILVIQPQAIFDGKCIFQTLYWRMDRERSAGKGIPSIGQKASSIFL